MSTRFYHDFWLNKGASIVKSMLSASIDMLREFNSWLLLVYIEIEEKIINTRSIDAVCNVLQKTSIYQAVFLDDLLW